ncbi:MAG: carbonic anhydrase [Hyphomonadaceae bacterium]
MDDLLAGYRRFREQRWPGLASLHRKLAKGQRPKTLVIACSDSRVDPSAIFDASPGELFVVRNVANLVPPYQADGAYHGVSAAIEFAVSRLEVETILVLGHAQCGGVAAALDEGSVADTDFLAPWLTLLGPAKSRLDQSRGDACTALEFESIRVSLENLASFPFIRAALDAGKVRLEGARFGVADGILELMDPNTGEFARID